MRRLLPLAVLAVAALARADVTTISLQNSGFLIGADERPLDGTTPITFRIVTQPSGAEVAQWEATCSVAVAGGYYAAALGAGCGGAMAPSVLPPGAARYLEIAIGPVTLAPRLALAPAPAAFDAIRLGGVPASGFARLQTGTTAAQDGSLHVSGAVKAATLEGSGALVSGVDAARLGGDLPAAFARVQAGTTAAQDGSLHVTGAVKAATLEGSGALVSGVDAAKIAGLDLAALDQRFASAATGSSRLGDVATCDAGASGQLRWKDGRVQVCNAASWVTLSQIPTPAIATLDPVRGRQAGGATLTITGSNFRAPVRVLVGGVASSAVTVVSATKVTALVPASASAGAKDVIVENDDGSTDRRTGGFTYVAQLLGDDQTYAASSCKASYDDGERASGAKWITLDGTAGSARRLWCEMEVEGGGWTLFEKAVSGSAAVTATTAAITVTELVTGTHNAVNAKLSDADIRILLGNGGGEILWKNTSDQNDYLRLKFPSALVTAWTASKRYNVAPRDFWMWRASESKWYGANGHYNNVHVSGYNDLGSSLTPAWTANNLESISGRSVYWNFHTSSANQANGNFLFYAR